MKIDQIAVPQARWRTDSRFPFYSTAGMHSTGGIYFVCARSRHPREWAFVHAYNYNNRLINADESRSEDCHSSFFSSPRFFFYEKSLIHSIPRPVPRWIQSRRNASTRRDDSNDRQFPNSCNSERATCSAINMLNLFATAESFAIDGSRECAKDVRFRFDFWKDRSFLMEIKYSSINFLLFDFYANRLFRRKIDSLTHRFCYI